MQADGNMPPWVAKVLELHKATGGCIVQFCPCGCGTFSVYSIEVIALRYIWQEVIQKNRDYIRLSKMAHDTGLRYDQCESMVTKFHAERRIPRLQIVEEVEG